MQAQTFKGEEEFSSNGRVKVSAAKGVQYSGKKEAGMEGCRKQGLPRPAVR